MKCEIDILSKFNEMKLGMHVGYGIQSDSHGMEKKIREEVLDAVFVIYL